MPVILPTTSQPPSRTNPKLLVIYGPCKVGKSTAVSQLPDTLLVDTEGGSDFLHALKVSIKNLDELDDLFKQCTDARAAGKPLYKRLAIDTMDRVEDWCCARATQQYKASVIGKSYLGNDILLDLPKGAGYPHMWRVVHSFIASAMMAADEIVLVGHVKDKMLVDKTLREVVATDLDLTGKVKNIVCSKADAIGYVARPGDGKQLILTFRTSDLRTCGNRAEHLAGKEIVLGEQVDGKLVTHWDRVYLTPENGTPVA